MSDYIAKQGTTALGIIGTALGGLATAGGLTGILGGNVSAEDRPVTRHELEQAQIIAAKDSEIALLKSEQNTEVKITDVYERIMTRVNADARAQADVNAAQAVYNATNGATVGVINSQVQQLMALTKLVVPADSVCPQPMARYNSWTAPTTPTTAVTGGA